MTRPSLRALAGALLTLGVACTLLATPSTATATAPTAPQVGQCHAMTVAEADAISDPDRPVPCSGSHTTRTIKVIKVSPRVAGNVDLAIRAGLKGCTPALARALGGTPATRELSAYQLVFFAPTAAQVRQGASWIRCDIALYGGRRLLPLPTDRTPALGALPHPDSIARCGQETRRSFRMTACSEPHNVRARGVVKVAARRYPGTEGLYRVAQSRCPRIGGADWYATWPSESGWKFAGNRHLVCYSRGR